MRDGDQDSQNQHPNIQASSPKKRKLQAPEEQTKPKKQAAGKLPSAETVCVCSVTELTALLQGARRPPHGSTL